MSRYSSSYYGPAGSQANQPSGYTYQAPNSSAPSYPSAPASTGYNYQTYGGSEYGGQQYSSSLGQQPANSNHGHAAAALSNLSSQNYSQRTSAARTNSTGQYDQSWYDASGTTPSYPASNLQAPSRTQSNPSPLYASAQPSSSLNRASVPDSTPTSTNTHSTPTTYQHAPNNASSRSRYQAPPAQAAHIQPQSQSQSQPPRYNSPMNMVQQRQQQSHHRQPSQSSSQRPAQLSPQIAQTSRATQQNSSATSQYPSSAQPNRQQSGSVEPSPRTVDPSQVYDNRAELQRKAQVEAEKSAKYEAELAIKKAEKERVAAEEARVEAEKQNSEEEAAVAKKKAQQGRKNEQNRKARDEKKQSNSAATTLQAMASSAAGAAGAPEPANAEESEMRAMFQKMREFNAKNPAMLAKMWEEERKTHVQSQSPQAEQSTSVNGGHAPPTNAAPAIPSQAPAAPSAASKSGIRPFKEPETPAQESSNGEPNGQASKASSNKKGRQPDNKASPTNKTPSTNEPPTGVQTPSAAAAPSTSKVKNTTEANLWPPTKKGDIAERTSKWLIGNPQNAGMNLDKDDVLKILDTNPNYAQLCEALEKTGLKFARSLLARELLKVTSDPDKRTFRSPGLAAARPKKIEEQVKAEVEKLSKIQRTVKKFFKDTKNDPQDVAKEKWQHLKANVLIDWPDFHSPIVNYQTFATYMSSLAAAAHDANTMDFSRKDGQTQGFIQIDENTGREKYQSHQPVPKSKPEDPPRPPADKEEAARKRAFTDLVDLTAKDSDEEAPPAKVMKASNPPINVARPGPQIDPLGYLYNRRQEPVQNGSPAITPSWPTMSTQPYRGIQPRTPHALMPVAPNGITSQPPKPQAAQAPRRPKGPLPEQIQQSRMKGKMLVEPIMRDRVARKSKYDHRTIARDVLLATGRHPDMRGLNAHLAPMQRLLSHYGGEMDSEGRGNRSDLATIRWDIIDPEPPKEAEPSKLDVAHSVDKGLNAVDDEDTMSHPPAHFTLGGDARWKNRTSAVYQAAPKKLGQGRVSLGEPLTKKGAKNTGTPPTSRRQGRKANETPASAAARKADMSGSAAGYTAFKQIGPDGAKKKGRPFGWRKSVHSREAQGLPALKQPGYKGTSNASGRLKESHGALTEEEQGQIYQIYKCQWEDCNSELHNLDTLKKHLIKLHCMPNEDAELDCEWEGCPGEVGDKVSFSDIKAWIAHVETAHLKPIAWQQGDGPRAGTPSSFDPDASYLSDAHGRSITPLISPPAAPTGNDSEPATPDTTRKMFTRPMRQGSPMEGFFLADLEEQKRAIGPTMDRTGCIFASDERRRTFLDDEDFEDEVSGSEHDAMDHM